MTFSLANCVAFVRDWHSRRVMHAELSGLNDHLLADIGIARHDIEKAVDRRFRMNAVNDNVDTRAA